MDRGGAASGPAVTATAGPKPAARSRSPAAAPAGWISPSQPASRPPTSTRAERPGCRNGEREGAARDGARVAVAAKSAEPHPKLAGTIHSVASEIEAAGGKALAIRLDVRDEAAIAQAVARAAEHRLFDVSRLETILLQDIAEREYRLPLEPQAEDYEDWPQYRQGAVTPEPDLKLYAPDQEKQDDNEKDDAS